MSSRLRVSVFVLMRGLALLVFLGASSLAHAQQPATAPPFDEELSLQSFLRAVETAISTNNRTAWLDLLSPNADRDAAVEFFDSIVPQCVTGAVVRLRDRTDLLGTLPGDGYSLMTEVFIETGSRGRIMTWTLDVRKPRDSTEPQPWRLVGHERLSFVEGLHRLALTKSKQFTARDLVIKSIDFELRLPAGEAFVAETSEGITALVLVGDGTMAFAPAPIEERGQLKIFSGTEALETSFSAAFVRMNPYEFEQQQLRQSLTETPAVDQRLFRRAQSLFDEDIGKSFSLDLSDLSRDTWSLLPQTGDFLAEVRTRRFDTLTFARSTGEPEDVTMFHRGRKKNIASYASPMKLASRGRAYNEDDFTEYDIVHYNIDASFSPERGWLEGQARLRLRIKTYALAALTLRLNDKLTVKGVTSEELGRLLFLRVRNQNAIVVNLPSAVVRDLELTLTVVYQGPMQTQRLDEESIEVTQEGGRVQPEDLPYVPPEPNWLFSNRSYWYPQGQVTDYATSTVRVTVPSSYGVAASGVLAAASAAAGTPGPAGPQVTYTFEAHQPARYIGLVVSRMSTVDASHVALEIVPPSGTVQIDSMTYIGNGVLASQRGVAKTIPPIGSRNTMMLAVIANRRQIAKGREMVGTAAEIVRFYSSIVGDIPFDSLTVAMVENTLPGGHSPAYVVMINNPSPLAPFSWRNDPAAFANYPEFYIAHEIAHQWWGQAVGWQNYHEQWLSEGISQYFAALYARERRGEPTFRELLRQFRRWALDQSDQGPISLGYRLGHLKNESRIFRAVLYNKSAGVLHMLRRLIGDDAFFKGMRRYYADNRFKKAGTDDLRRAMEAEAGQPLERFFQRWVLESALPRLRYSTTVEGQDLVIRFEQVATAPGGLFDVPVTVAINYTDRTTEEIVAITEAVVEKRIRLSGTLRNVEVNSDDAALAVFEKR
jgi:hypothetical protein